MANLTTNWTNSRVVAIVRLLIMLAAAIAGGFGLTLDPDSLATIIACAVALAAGVWSWYKNNNLTTAATTAQKYLEEIRKPTNNETETTTSEEN